MAPKRKGRAGKGAGKSPIDAEKEEVVEEVKEVVEDAPPEEAQDEEEAEEVELPSQKKAKAEKKGAAKRGAKAKPAAKKKGAPKKTAPEPNEEEEEDVVEKAASASKETSLSKVLIIEASKECNSIKTRAAKVQTGLKEALPDLEVLVNPDKPRKGCFEIRDKEGNIYLSLLNMPRPYNKLKSLDLDVTVEEIVAKIK